MHETILAERSVECELTEDVVVSAGARFAVVLAGGSQRTCSCLLVLAARLLTVLVLAPRQLLHLHAQNYTRHAVTSLLPLRTWLLKN